MITSGPITYASNRKYQLREGGGYYKSWTIRTPIWGNAARIEDPNSDTPWIRLHQDGRLDIKIGYTWDGPSGPTFDQPREQTLRASLVHDALYQLMRASKLPVDVYRGVADDLFAELLKADGMPWWRRFLWVTGVRKFARYAAEPQPERLHEAP